MAEILQTGNFILESPERPFVSREEGGHIRIMCKDNKITDRTKLNLEDATEYFYLSMIAGEALEKAMNLRGVKVVKINYQDMGSWPFKWGKSPVLHMHIFGRAWEAVHQKFPEAVYLPDRSSGFYDQFVSLDSDDILEIQKQIKLIMRSEKYSDLEQEYGVVITSE